MARGSVFKRCQCRDPAGRRVKSCRKNHGSWTFRVDTSREAAPEGRRQITRSGFPTRETAEAAMTEVLRELDLGTWVDDENMTLATWLDTWLEENAPRRAAKTMANYRGHVRDVWKPQLGHVKLRQLRRHHIERVLAELGRPIEDRGPGNVGRRVPHRSAATINGYRRTIRAALAAALRRELIAVNPAVGRMDALAPAAAPRLTIWQPEQTAQFLEAVAGDRLSALYELAAYAGLRRGELCGLRWSDLDEDGAGMLVSQTVVEVASKDLRPEHRRCSACASEHRGLLVKPPKSEAGIRWVPLVEAAQVALTLHRLAQDEERAACGAGYVDHDLVFCQVDGNPLRPSSVTASFDALIKREGLPASRLHDTRHGACSMLLAGGVPIEVVQMILGHSSPAVTRKIYAHVLKRSTAQQVEKASDLLTRHRRAQTVRNERSPIQGKPAESS